MVVRKKYSKAWLFVAAFGATSLTVGAETLTAQPPGDQSPTRGLTSLTAADLAAWAAAIAGILGAAGSFAAAWASFRAARLAVDLAHLPVRQQADFKRAQAVVIAQVISDELQRAYSTTFGAQQSFELDFYRQSAESVASLASLSGVASFPMLQRFIDSLDCFGSEGGPIIAEAISSIYAYNAELAAASDMQEYERMKWIDDSYHTTQAMLCQTVSEIASDKIRASFKVLRDFGVTITADNGVDDFRRR